jgi:glycosyltransferase involved in cell wall biosynthesis
MDRQAAYFSDTELPVTSVVIPTYNRGPAIADVIEPLLTDSFLAEVVVVVDGSDDGSMEILERLARRHSRLLPLWIPNSGEMGARERGVIHTAGQVVLLLDDDVRASPGLARAHAAWHAMGERRVVLGYMPTVLPDKRTPGAFATYIYAYEYEKACDRYEAEPDKILRYLWAGNLSLRRDDALAIGLQNASFSARYHPDREFGLRCLRGGMTGVFDRRLRADHIHHRGLNAFRRDARSQGEGRRRLCELHEDLIGPLPHGEFEQGLAWPIQRVVRAAHRRTSYTVVVLLTMGIVRAAGFARLYRVETAAARLLRRIEQTRGASSTRGDQSPANSEANAAAA